MVGPLRGWEVKPTEPLKKNYFSITKKSDQNLVNHQGLWGGGYPELSGPTTKKTMFGFPKGKLKIIHSYRQNMPRPLRLAFICAS